MVVRSDFGVACGKLVIVLLFVIRVRLLFSYRAIMIGMIYNTMESALGQWLVCEAMRADGWARASGAAWLELVRESRGGI
jgi:hypothetical protein